MNNVVFDLKKLGYIEFTEAKGKMGIILGE